MTTPAKAAADERTALLNRWQEALDELTQAAYAHGRTAVIEEMMTAAHNATGQVMPIVNVDGAASRAEVARAKVDGLVSFAMVLGH